MDFSLTFTVKDFLLFVLWAFACITFIYLILILRQALSSMITIKKILADNEKHIDSIIESIPGITKNAELLTDEIAHDVAAFRDTVDNVAKTTGDVTSKISENSGFVGGISSVMHTVAIAKAIYDRYFSGIYNSAKDIADEVDKVVNDN